MKKKAPKQVLKGFSWIYIFFAVVAIIFAVIIGCSKELPETFSTIVPKNMDMSPKDYLMMSFIASSLVELWYFWLLRRFISGKSKGTFYMVLLIIGVVGNIISLFFDPNMSTINLVLDAVALYFVLMARKEVQ